MTPEQKQFLLSRGYTEPLIRSEGIFGIDRDSYLEGVHIKDSIGCIAWPVRSMSGSLIGVQTREIDQKKYRWFQNQEMRHLPICYAQKDDFEKIYTEGKAIITEGAFDRIAVKRALPHMAVIARLSKGAANQLATFLERYVKQLWFAFDMDDPGKKATAKAELRLQDYMEVMTLRIPYHDPSTFLEKKGLLFTKDTYRKQMEIYE